MVVLASRSPQRETLLKQIGIHPVIVPADIEERIDMANVPASLKRLARQKAETALVKISAGGEIKRRKNVEGFWIIGADTVILLDNDILGKPQDREDAKRILGLLSGRAHRVLTGVFAGRAKRDNNGGYALDEQITRLAETEVLFDSLSEKKTAWYLSTGEWREAAGGYRIQGRGACLVAGIKGSFSNVVGLPLEQIYGILVRLGFIF